MVFYSRYGRAERLALAAGVGAIEAEGNIRLRRLPDDASAEAIQADAAWREALDRMNRDYVAPRPADPVWADVIVLATPADSSREVEAYVATLPALGPMTRQAGGAARARRRRRVRRRVRGGRARRLHLPFRWTRVRATAAEADRARGPACTASGWCSWPAR